MTVSAAESGITSIAGILRTHGAGRGDRLAVTSGPRSLTFAELDERSNQAAVALSATGVGEGDRVAYLDKNAPEFFELLFACSKLGAVLVPVNWRLAGPEVAAIIENSLAEVAIVGEEFSSMVEDLASDLAPLQTIVVVGTSGTRPEYDRWIAGHAPVDPGFDGAADSVVLQLYTSGTTGLPKGVMLTEHNLISLASSGGDVLCLGPDSVNLVPMPLFHVAGSGYALVGLYVGCHTVLVRQADPVDMLKTMSEQKVTNTFVVPAVLSVMLGLIEGAVPAASSLEVISYGASPISEDVLTRAMTAFGCRFVQAYGLTETTGTITLLSDEDHRRALAGEHPERLRSAGRPMPSAEVRIVDVETGNDRDSGQVGEIWVRSPQNTVGYWQKPEDTDAILRADGWLRTGDAGYVDAENFLFIHDRVKDMIITGGENVYPTEVENVLMSHPDVDDVAVIGVPDDRWGETVKAFVVAAPGASPGQGAIIEFARERLAHFKCPTSVELIEALPRNASGKVLERELRSRFWEGSER